MADPRSAPGSTSPTTRPHSSGWLRAAALLLALTLTAPILAATSNSAGDRSAADFSGFTRSSKQRQGLTSRSPDRVRFFPLRWPFRGRGAGTAQAVKLQEQ